MFVQATNGSVSALGTFHIDRLSTPLGQAAKPLLEDLFGECTNFVASGNTVAVLIDSSETTKTTDDD